MSWSLTAEEEGREEEGGERGDRGEEKKDGKGRKEGNGGRIQRWSRHSLFPGLPTCIQDGVTFSFLSLAVVFLSGYVHSSSLSSDTSWSLSRGVLFLGYQRYTGVYWSILEYTGVYWSIVGCGVLFLGYQRYTEVYRRTGFNCENLIIANCRFF